MKQRAEFPIFPLTEETVPAAALLCRNVFVHPWSEATYRRELKNPDSAAFVCMDGDIAVGFIHCDYVVDEMSLNTLAVAENYRRQGIARRLWTMAEQRVYGICKVCYLEVRESNLPARKLYEALGFVQNGVRRRYYTDPDEAAVLMCKRLPIPE